MEENNMKEIITDIKRTVEAYKDVEQAFEKAKQQKNLQKNRCKVKVIILQLTGFNTSQLFLLVRGCCYISLFFLLGKKFQHLLVGFD